MIIDTPPHLSPDLNGPHPVDVLIGVEPLCISQVPPMSTPAPQFPKPSTRRNSGQANSPRRLAASLSQPTREGCSSSTAIAGPRGTSQ